MLIDDDSLLSVFQIFVNEFLIFCPLGPINVFVEFLNLMLRTQNSNFMLRIHVFYLMLIIFLSLYQNQRLLEDARLKAF